MFLCAVAHPRWDDVRDEWFDGKIGIWPFIERVAAKRSSRNRPAGTMETKPLSVTKETYINALVGHVIPAVEAKWPQSCRHQSIVMQHDNAPPHKVEAFQPANSPDMNVLDLGFFNAIQSLQYTKESRSIDELITNTVDAFNELSRETLDDTFVTLQTVMHECLLASGGNQ
ncbi:TPA: hypothetical protein N0F65_003381 [Lagenidium giganteum]|uniref:Transposase n=1 Tax=Lagenidium giganteum TaxID=4803 RepID=A0AAV2YVU0_9STRA|nr:TPA: hypothetical protein N0F65_003381 [Lagenidium giganteum]